MGYMKELDILSERPEIKTKQKSADGLDKALKNMLKLVQLRKEKENTKRVYLAEGGIQNDLILTNIKDSEGISIEDDGFEYDDLLTATCAETGQKLRRIRGDCYNIVELTDYGIKEYEDMYGKIKR